MTLVLRTRECTDLPDGTYAYCPGRSQEIHGQGT